MNLMTVLGFNKPARYAARQPLFGVNLGGWLVLEKWMTPKLFDGLKASDEYSLCSSADAAVLDRLRDHRDTFITREDFVWLGQQGIQAVRLPVGYWTFGDEAPYAGTIDYVDKAFRWAGETGIKVLLDMHGAPGSQNGLDHSGRQGVCRWHTSETNIIKTLEVLARLVKRYAKEPSLLGFELLNEPKWSVPQRVLLRYYQMAYKIIRTECGNDAWVVFYINFWAWRWKRALRTPKYTNVYLDTHEYQTYSQKDKKLDVAGHLHKTMYKVPKAISKKQRYHPVIVGEWSLALDQLSLKGLDAAGKEAAWRAYGAAQLLAYDTASAWFYWNYKTEGRGIWNFRDCIDTGLLPKA